MRGGWEWREGATGLRILIVRDTLLLMAFVDVVGICFLHHTSHWVFGAVLQTAPLVCGCGFGGACAVRVGWGGVWRGGTVFGRHAVGCDCYAV